MLSRHSKYSTFTDHWHDVLAGSVLGLVIAYFSYRQYYPSLASEKSHRSYTPRIKLDGPILPTNTLDHDLPEVHAEGRHSYHDEDLQVPPGTVTRPERSSMNMNNVWKDDDHDTPGNGMQPVPLQ